MNGNEITVGVVLSLLIVVSVCGFWIWLLGKTRRKPGLPPPDRSCDRDWYSAGRDAK